MRTLYTVLVVLFSPVLFVGLIFRYGWRRTRRGLAERWVWGKPLKTSTLWVHAASVGEVRAIGPFLTQWVERHPSALVTLTCTTSQGVEVARSLPLAIQRRLAPLDLPGCVNAFLDQVSPQAAVFVETELWPNMIRGLTQRKIPWLIVNGRLSDKSFHRYGWIRGFIHTLLSSVHHIAAQDGPTAKKFINLGASPKRVSVGGNLKYDVPLPDLSQRVAHKERLGFSAQENVWVCGSTREGEEELLLQAWTLWAPRGWRWVVAPRHLERADKVAALLNSRGLAVCRRSQGRPLGAGEVLLLDTLGELDQAYGAGDIAFVGGSLVPKGGQNPLEPARWGLPILWGPSMENFRESSRALLQAGGAKTVHTPEELARSLAEWAESASLRRAIGRAAREAAQAQSGAVERALTLVEKTLSCPKI